MENPHQPPKPRREAFRVVRTEDGTVIAFDPASGLSVSRVNLDDALAALARLIGGAPP